jgi:hypothetical protein
MWAAQLVRERQCRREAEAVSAVVSLRQLFISQSFKYIRVQSASPITSAGEKLAKKITALA